MIDCIESCGNMRVLKTIERENVQNLDTVRTKFNQKQNGAGIKA